MSANESQTVALTANSAQTVTFALAFTEVEVVNTTNAAVLIYARTDGVTATAGANEEDCVAGGMGASNTFPAIPGTKSISLISNVNCTVVLNRTRS